MSNLHEELTDPVVNEEMANKLENAYMAGEVKQIIQFSPSHINHVDEAIETLASLPRRDFTIEELVEFAEEHFYIRFNRSDISAIDAFYPLYADMEAIASRPDNLLNMGETDSWVTRFHMAVAKMLAVHGSPVKPVPSSFGWEDDYWAGETKLPSPEDVIAVFNVTEDAWGDFAGTFADDDKKTGMSADFVYKNGYSRRIRCEGTIMEIMQKL